MSDLTNKTLWMARALNHKRNSPRELPVSRQATWRGITARALDILDDGDRAVIVVAAAKTLRPVPSAHDILNARVSALVFSKQESVRSFESLSVYLQDQDERRFEVRVELSAIESLVRKTLRTSAACNDAAHNLPSPVVCFLLQQANVRGV